MLKLAFLNLFRRKTRILLISVSIILGVSSSAAVLILQDSVRTQVDSVTQIEAQKVDWVVHAPYCQRYEPPDDENSRSTVENQSEDKEQETPVARCQEVLDAQAVNSIQNIDNQVTKVVGVVQTANNLSFLDKKGQKIDVNTFIQVNTSPVDDAQFNNFKIINGQAPTQLNEIALDESFAKQYEFTIGQTVSARDAYKEQGKYTKFKIVGLTTLESAGPLRTLMQVNVFHPQGLRLLTDTPQDTFTLLKLDLKDSDLKPETGAGLTLSRQITQSLSSDYAVETASQLYGLKTLLSDLKVVTTAISYVLLFFIVLAMLVGLFVVINTFNIILLQRAKELALLRSLAFSKGQIFQLVILEAILIGLSAGVLGLVLGTMIAWGVLSLPFNFINEISLVLKPTSFIYPMILAVLITFVASLNPAFKSSRKRPIEVLTQTDSLQSKSLVLRLIFGSIFVGIGALILFLIIGLSLSRSEDVDWDPATIWATVFGIVTAINLIFISVAILMPYLAKISTSFLKFVTKSLGQINLRLALGNIQRQPHRVSATTNTLMVGITLVVLISVLISSFRTTTKAIVNEFSPSDWTISYDYSSTIEHDYDLTQNPVPYDLLAELKKVEAIKDVTPVWVDDFSISNDLAKSGLTDQDKEFLDNLFQDDDTDGNTSPLTDNLPPPGDYLGDFYTYSVVGTDVSNFNQVFGDKLSEKEINNLKAGQIAVSDDYWQGSKADNRDSFEGDKSKFELGQTVVLRGPADKELQLIVGAVFDLPYNEVDFILDNRTYEKIIEPKSNFTSILANNSAGVDEETAKKAIEEVLQNHPTYVGVFGKSEFVKAIDDFFDWVLRIFYALFSLMLVVAFIGVFNTLSLSIFERTREIGLLRAVGLTRRQIRSTINLEALIIVYLGVFMGILLGVLFAWIFYLVITSNQLIANIDVDILFNIPLTQLLIYCLVCTVVALLASLWPAMRASLLNIIQALRPR